MVETARSFTTAEAGVVSGLGRKAIDNAFDKKLVPSLRVKPMAKALAPRSDKGSGRRMISADELVWISVFYGARGVVPPHDREKLFKLFKAKPEARQLQVSRFVIVDVGAARDEIMKRAGELEQARRNIESHPGILGGEPVFRGTRVPVYDIAASARKGIAAERILAAYPSLTEKHLEQAQLYWEAVPPRGRPRTPPGTTPKLVRVEDKAPPRKRRG